MKRQNSDKDLIWKYIFLFLLASVIGWVYELDLVISEGTLNYFKFFPTSIYTLIFAFPYGIAGLILYKIANVLTKYKFTKDKLPLRILIYVTVILLVELVTGLLALNLTGVMPWDYSHHFMNYLGLISVPIAVRWFIIVTAIGLFVYKPAKKFIKKPLSKKIRKLTQYTLIFYGAYLVILLILKYLGVV